VKAKVGLHQSSSAQFLSRIASKMLQVVAGESDAVIRILKEVAGQKRSNLET
jgi:hypothetical protein